MEIKSGKTSMRRKVSSSLVVEVKLFADDCSNLMYVSRSFQVRVPILCREGPANKFGHLSFLLSHAHQQSFLQALGKPRQSLTSSSAPSTTHSSPPSASTLTLVADEFYSPISENDSTSMSSRSMSVSTHGHPPGSFTIPGGGRSSSQTYSIGGKEKGKDAEGKNGVVLRRPEDVYKVVKDRILSWSYMMEWYQG